jgi:hypothetical protein
MNCVPSLEGKIRTVEAELLGTMIRDVVGEGDIDEGVDELIDTSVALALHVKRFQDVMPPENIEVSTARGFEKRRYVRFDEHISIAKLKNRSVFTIDC